MANHVIDEAVDRAAYAAQLRERAARMLEFIRREGVITPMSPVKLEEENVFTRRSSRRQGKTRTNKGQGNPPMEYNVVEMLADLKLAVERVGDAEEVASLYFPLVRILKL